MRTVGAYEAKTHLSQLLDEVAQGNTIAITRHGIMVAMIVPPANTAQHTTAEVISALKAFRRDKTLGGARIQDLIEDGHRY